jgi:hypothetical protein
MTILLATQSHTGTCPTQYRCQSGVRYSIEKAIAYTAGIQPMLIGDHVDGDFIINMDQTLLYFVPTVKRTYAPKGSQTVTLREPVGATNRATGAFSVTANGGKLMPLIIYKASNNGSVRKTLDEFPTGAVYTTQKKGGLMRL